MTVMADDAILRVDVLSSDDAASMTGPDLNMLREDIVVHNRRLRALAESRVRTLGPSAALSRWTILAARAEKQNGVNIQTIFREQERRKSGRRAMSPVDAIRAGRNRSLADMIGKIGADVAMSHAFVDAARERLSPEHFRQLMEIANAACLEAATRLDSCAGSEAGSGGS